MDVLSEVLKVVKLQGAVFYNGEFSSPWSLCSPPSLRVAPHLAPGAGHVIIYHLLTEGRASVRLLDGQAISLDAGDLVIFPHGDSHIIENGRAAKTVDLAEELARRAARGLKLGKSRNSFVASWHATDNSARFFSVDCHPFSKSRFVTMLRADGWKTRSFFP
jgi:hypothetical protein